MFSASLSGAQAVSAQADDAGDGRDPAPVGQDDGATDAGQDDGAVDAGQDGGATDVGQDDGAADVGQDDGGDGTDGRDDGGDGTDGRDDGAPDDAPQGVTLRALAFAGTGCPAGSVRGELPVEGHDLLLFYDSFAAEVGPDVPLSQSRKNCQLNLDFDYPSGWQYTVESVSYNGHVLLEDGLDALVGSSFYFQGSAATARAETTFTGPERREYQVTDTFETDDGNALWSPCEASRSLNVNVQVRVNALNARDRHGVVTFATGELPGSLLQLKWRRCDGGDGHDGL
jgi:hypothetical protein